MHDSYTTSLAALLPESNLISVTTSDLLPQAPAVVPEEKTEVTEALDDKPVNVVLIFSTTITADQIKETLNSVPESILTLELLQSAPTDKALQLLGPSDLITIPDFVSDLEADLELSNDNLAVSSLINEPASKGNVAPIQAISDNLMEQIPTIDFIILKM